MLYLAATHLRVEAPRQVEAHHLYQEFFMYAYFHVRAISEGDVNVDVRAMWKAIGGNPRPIFIDVRAMWKSIGGNVRAIFEDDNPMWKSMWDRCERQWEAMWDTMGDNVRAIFEDDSLMWKSMWNRCETHCENTIF